MTMLEEINELVQQLASGQTTHDAGLDRARPIERAGTQYGPALDAVMSALCGLVFGVILGIAWIDVLLGGAFSIVSLSGLLAWSLLGGLLVRVGVEAGASLGVGQGAFIGATLRPLAPGNDVCAWIRRGRRDLRT